jgi:hypothetical protein
MVNGGTQHFLRFVSPRINRDADYGLLADCH